MERIAKFEKVSFDQFKKDWLDTFGLSDDVDPKELEEAQEAYNAVTIPKRATAGSAGYDFVCPLGFTLFPGDEIKFPTGIRCKMKEGWVLKCYPRSGLGFKYRMQLNNTVGIIDSDYYDSANEGHIQAKIKNDGDKTFTIHQGDRFMQGIFVEYGITEDDDTNAVRDGGFGSTGE